MQQVFSEIFMYRVQRFHLVPFPGHAPQIFPKMRILEGICRSRDYSVLGVSYRLQRKCGRNRGVSGGIPELYLLTERMQ